MERFVEDANKVQIWETVSTAMQEKSFIKSPKQCKERWQNYLNPELVEDKWSHDEYWNLLKLHRRHRNHWKSISSSFKGRTDNCIKNQFFSIIRKCLRKLSKLFLNPSEILSINLIKPKVLSDFLEVSIQPKNQGKDSEGLCFESIRDLVDYFYQSDMPDYLPNMSEQQTTLIRNAFHGLYTLK